MNNQQEKKNKKRGLWISMILHTSIILLALYPFLTIEQEDIIPPNRAVEIQFASIKTPTSGASSKRVPKAKKKAKPTPSKVKPKEVKPKPNPKPTPKKKPVITSSEPNPPIKSTPKPIEPKPNLKPVPPAPPQPNPTPVVIETETVEVEQEGAAEEVADDNRSGSNNSDNSANNDGDSALEGEGTGDDFSGDGLFKRKVIYRADVKKLTKRNGKITVNLCVDRTGHVISAEENEELTTILDRELVEKAVSLTKRYRFEKDNSAPREQCGKLTFLFKVE